MNEHDNPRTWNPFYLRDSAERMRFEELGRSVRTHYIEVAISQGLDYHCGADKEKVRKAFIREACIRMAHDIAEKVVTISETAIPSRFINVIRLGFMYCDPSNPPAKALIHEDSSLRTENERLRAENERLRKLVSTSSVIDQMVPWVLRHHAKKCYEETLLWTK